MFETSPVRDGANSVPELAHIDVTFTEEIKDGDLASTYTFVTNASVHNFSVTSVQRLSTYTYRLLVSGSVSSTGSVELDIAPLKDYNNNSMDTAVPVEFTGNVNIPIRSTVNHNGVSTTGGYASVQLKFHHEYTADLTNANTYEVRLTSGAIDCTIGSVLASGSNLAPDAAAGGPNEITVNVPAATFTSGINRLVICISNANNPNAANRASALIIRDDVAPTLTFSPAGGSYKDPQSIELTCSNNADKIAYASSSQQGSVPTDPAAPTFDPATGNILIGSPYGTSLTAENPANPTYTKFIWRCVDIAGNLSTALALPVQYYIDNTIPGVSVNLSTYRRYISATNPTTSLTFSTDQTAKTYNIRRNGTNCDAGGDGTLLATGTTPATPGQTITVPLDISTHFTATNSTYPVRICVAGTGIQWGTAYLEITRDDTVPTITPSVVTGDYGALQSVQFTCDDTFGSVHRVAYNTTVADGLTLPALPAVPVYNTATGDITNGIEQTTALSPEDRRTTRYTFNCIDRAGNVATAGSTRYTIDATLPIVNFVSLSRSAVSGNAGAYGDTTVTFTSSRVGLTYRIRRVANCDHSGTPAETLLPDATISAANANQSVILPASAFPSNGVSYPLRICVYNLLGASSHQTVSLNVTRDDSPPATVTGLTVTAATTTSVTLGWTAATDVGPAGVSGYRIYQTTTQGSYGSATVYTSNTNSVNISGLNPTDTYYFVVRAIDSAGNLSSGNSNEVQSRFVLSVTVAGYSSALNGPFRVQLGAGENLSFTANGTQTFSQVFLSGDAYTLPIIAQPATQNCAFVGNQYGTMTASATLQVTCVSGYSSGGGLIVHKPAPLNYLLYRGNATIIAGGGNTGSMCPGAVSTTCYDGTGTNAQFANPHGMTIVGGTIYVADRSNNRIRSIDTTVSPVVTATFAGDGSAASGDSTNRLTARFNAPQAISTDGANLFVVESPAVVGQTGYLRKINIATGNVTTLAGGGTGGTPCPGSSQPDCTDGTGAQTRFNGANGIVYHNGFLYITEFSNNRVRRMNLATGVVDTIAGDGATTSGVDNVSGTSTSFNGATGAAVVGNQLYVADFNGHRIRAVSLTAPFTVTAVTGTGTAGHADGPLASARFYNPDHLTTDGYNLFVTEYAGDGQTGRRLRRIDLRKGRVSTIAGNSLVTEAAGIGAAAAFAGPVGVASDGRQLFVGAYDSGRIFRVTDSGLVGYWPLAGNANGYASDVTTSYDGTINGSPSVTATDRFGNSGSFAFDGVDDYLSISGNNLPLANSARTICAWVRLEDATNVGNDGIITYGQRGANTVFGLRMSSSTQVSSWSASVDVNFNTPLPVMNWTHTCVTHDGTISKVFQNGFLVNSASASYNTQPGNLCIGERSAPGGGAACDTPNNHFFKGSIADIRIYNRPLNEGEINELAQDAAQAQVGASFNTRATGLLAHYEFNVSASLVPSGPIGGNLAAPGSQPIGVHGDAGGAFYYDGSTNNSSSGYGLPSGNSARTLCIWIKPQISQSNRVLVAHGTAALNRGFGMNLETNAVSLWSYGNSVSLYTYTPQLNTWQHLCGTFEGGNGRIYANGVLLGTQVLAGTLDTAGDQLAVGSNLGGGNIYQGTIDDVRVYNSALTQPQIRQLATQVPAGLVARYDFTGDRDDISGFGQHLSNNGAALDADRFGNADASARFTASAYMEVTATALPVGNQARTLCAWTKPSSLGASFSVPAMYGSASAGWGIGMNTPSTPPPLGRIFVLDHVGDLIYEQPHGLNIWRHVCVTHTGTNERLFVDAYPVTALTAKTLSTAIGQLYIGKATWANDFFTGNIDDVRIYNRTLSLDEIQVLQQQPNKKIQLSGPTVQGDMGGSPSGIVGADQRCPVNFKALIVDGTARRACSTASCSAGITEHIDWVLRPNITYLRGDGVTLIATSDFNGVLPFPLTATITGAGDQAWTGLNADWTPSTHTCNSWTTTTNQGQYGQGNATAGQAISANNAACTASLRLYCVEQ